MKYRIEVWRVVKDAQTRVIEVEADNARNAITKAEHVYQDDDSFWDDVRQEPYDSGSPNFDILEPT